MWSQAFTSSRGIVPDHYQRITLFTSSSELLSSSSPLMTARKNGFSHFLVNLSGDESDEALTTLGINFKKVHDMEAFPKGSGDPSVFISLIFPLNHHSEWMKKTISSLSPNLLVLEYVPSKTKREMCEEFLTFRSCVEEFLHEEGNHDSVKMGICYHSYETYQLQWIVNNLKGKLDVVHLGNVKLPNLNVHNVEFLHSHGINTLMSVTQSCASKRKHLYLQPWCDKYSKSPLAILGKCLLQLGVIVSFPWDIQEEGLHFPTKSILTDIVPLFHPFVYRRKFFADKDLVLDNDFEVYSFILDILDVEQLSEISENTEIRTGPDTSKSTKRAEARQLSYLI
jgi:hypothetical protein